MVSQKAFNELAENATNYIQKCLDRIKALEERVDALEAKKITRKKPEEAN